MELLLAICIGSLVASGVYLTLRAHVYPVVIGLTLLAYAVNLFLLASGRLVVGGAPLADRAQADYPDPLPQALVLTAIVIGFAMTAFQVVLALRAYAAQGTDHVDGAEGDPDATAQATTDATHGADESAGPARGRAVGTGAGAAGAGGATGTGDRP